MEDSKRPDVVVVGSGNLDIVLRVDALPAPGETVPARERSEGPGGKGSNQAIAARRLGASVALIASLGGDAGAEVVLGELRVAGVETAAVRICAAPTGSACVVVDSAGENQIVVDAGANAELVDLTDRELALVAGSRALLCQLEVPVPTVAAAVRHARSAGVPTILNAAPAAPLPAELVESVDVVIVNQSEAAALAGVLDQVPVVVMTLGAQGVEVSTAGESERVEAVHARRVVDTTGAGDTFCGAFATAIAWGEPPVDAARWACVAASLSVERPGAARSAPTADEVQQRLVEL